MNKFSWKPCFVSVAVLTAISLNTADDSARRVGRGNNAFERGDFTAALVAYSAAEERTTDPGLVAFNKAATLYRLGRYREAELHYLRCVENAGTERAFAALYNAGNCIVQQADDHDQTGLEAAIKFYELALQRAANDHNIRTDDVEHNLQIAQALLEKARLGSDRQRPNGANTSESRPRPGDGSAEIDARDPGGMPGRTGERSGRAPGAGSTDHLPPPGAGNIPVLPDADELVRLSAVDTASYLESVATRVHRERVQHRRTHATVPSTQFRNW